MMESETELQELGMKLEKHGIKFQKSDMQLEVSSLMKQNNKILPVLPLEKSLDESIPLTNEKNSIELWKDNTTPEDKLVMDLKRVDIIENRKKYCTESTSLNN